LIFSVPISPLKVLNVSNRGDLTFPALWPFAEGLFYLKKKDFKTEGLFYLKKKDFKKLIVAANQKEFVCLQRRKICEYSK